MAAAAILDFRGGYIFKTIYHTDKCNGAFLHESMLSNSFRVLLYAWPRIQDGGGRPLAENTIIFVQIWFENKEGVIRKYHIGLYTFSVKQIW